MVKSAGISLDVNNKISSTELEELLNMELDAINSDPSCISSLPPLLIHGVPGVGKSSIVKHVCESRGIEFIDVRLAEMEPCDIRGLPVPNKELKQMDWFVNGVWPRDPNGKGIIFLDELTSADRSIQVAAYELVLDRRLGKLYEVPPGYMIVAAGNNVTDHAIATTMSSALANRFMHVELTDDAEAWVKWAIQNEIHPSVVGFIQYRPGILFSMENENLERGWPSPRSWERVSEMCKICKSKKILKKAVYGLVGNKAGVEFMTFYKINAEFESILDIMLDPGKKIVIPEEIDRKYAMCAAMNYLLWKGKDEDDERKRIDGFFRICSEMSADFSTMAVSNAIISKNPADTKARCSKFLANSSFKTWLKLHGKALSKRLDVSKIFK